MKLQIAVIRVDGDLKLLGHSSGFGVFLVVTRDAARVRVRVRVRRRVGVGVGLVLKLGLGLHLYV